MRNDSEAEVRTEVRDRVGWITISRPHKRNALTAAMWDAIASALRSLSSHGDLVAIFLRGADGTFGAGADLQDVLDATAGRAEAEKYCSAAARRGSGC